MKLFVALYKVTFSFSQILYLVFFINVKMHLYAYDKEILLEKLRTSVLDYKAFEIM